MSTTGAPQSLSSVQSSDSQSQSQVPFLSRHLKVAYQGEAGAYSEQAVLNFFENTSYHIEPVPLTTFSHVFDAVVNNQTDCGVIPIENSLGGSIHENFDNLLKKKEISIVGELDLRISHCLLALPGIEITKIRRVISHPQALAQCEHYLDNLGVAVEKAYDTAGSAKIIAEQQLKYTAAIASSRAAQVYGLSILASAIEDDDQNYTRFLLIVRTSHPKDPISPIENATIELIDSTQDPNLIIPNTHAGYKTSLVFALKDEPGVLFKALTVFALRDLHLSKIESRPNKRIQHSSTTTNSIATDFSDASPSISNPFKYLFYLDFLGHQNEVRAQNAINNLREFALFVKVLGSYRMSASSSTSSSSDSRQLIAKPYRTASLTSLKIAIIGFGTFGQFLARAFVRQGHQVLASSRTNYGSTAKQIGVRYFVHTQDMFQEQDLDCILIATSILSFEEVIKLTPWHLQPNALVIDVLSVKQHAKSIFEKILPITTDILCTHPMFGPDSGKYSWQNLPFVFEKVRISNVSRCNSFLQSFAVEGCRMLEMTSEAHDSYAAGSQFITHTTGRVLAKVGCHSTPINTKGFNMLLELISNTARDSLELYKGLYLYNPHSASQLESFGKAFEEIRNQLQPTEKETDTSNFTDVHNNSHTGLSFAERTTISPRVLSLAESKTVALTDLAKSLGAQGIPVISLTVGEPLDVETPPVVKDATIKALQDGHTKYTALAGIPSLRTAITEKLLRDNQLQYTAEQILVSNGAKQSIAQALMTLSCPGDEVIIPAPYWVSYPDMCILAGSTPTIVNTSPDNGYLLTANQLKSALTPKTKVLILCTPSNPTGSVYSLEQLMEIAKVVQDHPSLWVISDEIYEYLLYDNTKHVSIASLPGMYERTIVVNGFSKAYAMTGFRLGYLAAPLPIVRSCAKIQSQVTTCASSLSQYAALAALTNDLTSFIEDMLQKLEKKRNMVLELLRAIPNIHIFTPKGAFYALPRIDAYYGYSTKEGKLIKTSDEFCIHLLNNYRVALVPGSAFGDDRTVRISYGSEYETVRAGIEGMVKCIKELIPPSEFV